VKLPGATAAVVDAAKVRDYLLSPDHPVGHAKARFFTSLGFTQDHWPELRDALLRLAHEAEAEPEPESPFGQKYILRGIIEGPGPTPRRAVVEAVWIVLYGETMPRLVTAYPGDRR
jgi:hypothetical protein